MENRPSTVGVRFSKIGKIYHFDASNVETIGLNDYVIVDTVRGRQIGEVIQFVDQASTNIENLRQIDRLATSADLLVRQNWSAKQTAAMIDCREQSFKLQLEGIKIIHAEYAFDGSRLTFMFSTESEDKYDLKSLKKDMQRKFFDTQVDFRQIGPRDVAKLLGGMGACGLETRCCSKFITEFSPISIKMAKEQGISLTPTEITGMCGRLRCCLIYEYEQYVAARKELPKKGKKVSTPEGEGKVIDVYPLREVVLVEIFPKSEEPNDSSFRRVLKEFPKLDIEPWDELEALRRKSEGGCDHGGECSCGAKTKDVGDV